MGIFLQVLILIVVAIAVCEATILENSDNAGVNKHLKRSINSRIDEPRLNRFRRSRHSRNRKRNKRQVLPTPSDFEGINDGNQNTQNRRAVVAHDGMEFDVQPLLGPVPINPNTQLGGYGKGLGSIFGVLVQLGSALGSIGK